MTSKDRIQDAKVDIHAPPGRLAALWAAISASRWAGLLGRGAAYLAAFVILALIGSGRFSRWLAPPAQLAAALPVSVAEAATATAPAASASPPPPPAADAGADAAPAEPQAAAGVAADGKVILNLATEEDLRRLPGIGATRAKAILALRARLKRFTRVEDLLRVKGLGRRSLARLRPLVRVD